MSVVKDSSIAFPARYYTKTQDYLPDGTPNGPPTIFNSTKTVKAVRTREGQRLPKWKLVIKSGSNATTPLSGVWDSVWTRQLSVVHKWISTNDGSSRVTEARGDVVAFFAPLGPTGPLMGTMIDSSIADNRARARFYKQLRQIQVQFSGPTFLGELGETLRMIRRPAQAIRDSCDRYYRSLSKWKGRNRPPTSGPKKWSWRQELEKVAGGLWLENSFGWQPLLNDVRDAVKAYERLTPPLADAKVISVGDTDSADSWTPYSGMGWGDNNGNHANVGSMMFYMFLDFAKSSCTVRYKGKVSLTTEATKWDNLALFGFTPSEFIPTAWELLPWSFLIDYFTNIGDILSSSVTRTTPVNYVNCTVRKTAHLYGRYVPQPQRPGGFPWDWKLESTGGSAFFDVSRKSVSRSAGSGVPLPTIQFESGLNVGQMCNITALLTNFLDIHPQDKPKRNWHR